MFCKTKHLLLQIKHWWAKQLLEMNWESFIMCTWPSEDSAVIYNNFPLFSPYLHYKKIALFGHPSWSMPTVKETPSANNKTMKHNFMWKNKIFTWHMLNIYSWFVGYRAAVVCSFLMGVIRKQGRIVFVKYNFVRSTISMSYFLFWAADTTAGMF